VLEQIGAGGMGEVYRARDPQLGREVAIKVLPPTLGLNADRLQRFQLEARTAGMLNHPNLLTVFELGVSDGAPYIVTELLEGETLRERLQGGAALPARKVIDHAVQIANGLAAAHEKGVIHRDLKPENLYLTRDGRVKILDFGLAKLATPASGEMGDAETVKRENETAPGHVMGTVGYMAPEQVRGQVVDHRADLFSLGTVLYEMLTGRRAFRGDSSIETLNAILKEEPAELSTTGRLIPPALQRIVEHCLEKSPESRFQSARDLAFHLEAISGNDSGTTRSLALKPQRPRILPVALVALLLLSVGGAYLAGRGRAVPAPPKVRPLTFEQGTIRSARFLPDGQTVVYGAALAGGPLKMYQARVNSTGSAPLALPEGDILSVAENGDLAVSVGRTFDIWLSSGTLAMASLLGGTPRPVLENVSYADFSPAGNEMARVRSADGKDYLEWPAGKTLKETNGYFSHLRTSPDGSRLAYLDHNVRGDNRGDVVVAERSGKTITLVRDWSAVEGLAWSRDGKEVWFTGDSDGTIGICQLYAVDLKGRLRTVWSAPSELMLLDVGRDGRVLLTGGGVTDSVFLSTAGSALRRTPSWLGVTIMTPDGKRMLFPSYGTGAGRYYSTYARGLDGLPPVRLGEGEPLAISPDGKWALSLRKSEPQQLLLLPIGAGEPHPLNTAGIARVWAATFTPDGGIIIRGRRPASTQADFWWIDRNGAPPRQVPVSGRIGWGNLIASPDGRWICSAGTEGVATLVPAAGGVAQPVAGLEAEETLVSWSDPHTANVVKQQGDVLRIDHLDVFTGRRTHLRDIAMPEMTGVMGHPMVLASADGSVVVTSLSRMLNSLYLVEGLQ
jgi:hypothetical protein